MNIFNSEESSLCLTSLEFKVIVVGVQCIMEGILCDLLHVLAQKKSVEKSNKNLKNADE